MKIRSKWFFILGFLAIVSCDPNRFYENNVDFANESWSKDSVAIFEVEITDTLTVYNIYLNNRINGQYEYSNLYLFITTQLPNEQLMRDTLECILADPTGRWLGKGFGSVWSNRIPYRRNIRFPLTGKYTFYVEQAMREEELKHILNAGIRIEKSTK
ncbi:MAG: gliding motility lipoprotein GldH [Salinivirgaceae bacterium]|jgi:gliding motility-associated lipoprotein GldH